MKKRNRVLALLLSLLMLLSLTACGEKPADQLVRELLGEEAMSIREKDYSTPLDYYRAVEQRRMDEYLAILTENSYLQTASADPFFCQTDLLISLDQSVLDPELLDLATQSVGMDLSWIRSLGISGVNGRSGALAQAKAALRLNDTDIVHFESVVDAANMKEYLAVPELNPASILFDAAESAGSLFTESQLQDLLSGRWGDSAELAGLIRRYSGLALENITKVDLAEGTASAGGVSCPCTVATVRIEGEDMLAVAKAVLNAALEDETLEKYAHFFITLLQSSGALSAPSGSGGDLHARYLELLRDALQQLENTAPEDLELSVLMTVTIDKKGEILGRRVELISDDGDRLIVSLFTARDGDKLGVDAQLFATGFSTGTEGQSAGDGQLDLTLTGQGLFSSDGRLSGDFSARIALQEELGGERKETDIPLFRIRLDGQIGLDGFLGETELTPSPELIDKLLEELGEAPEPAVKLLRSLSLYSVNRSEGGFMDLACVLRSDGRDLLTVTLVQSAAEPFALIVPEDTVDVQTWLNSIDFVGLSSILSNLRDAGFPVSMLGGLLT